jgi:NAD kinase
VKILIAIKRSKWERDLIHYGSEEAVKRLYSLQNDNYERVYSSHLRQLKAREKIATALPDARYAYREELDGIDYSGYDLVASLGGDNHFVYVGHFVLAKPIAGINSDPETSHGILLNFDPDSFISGIEKNGIMYPTIEEWTCIEGELIYPNGDRIHTGAAVSEISVHNGFADNMSRYLIRRDEESFEEQKSSGILLSTGVGSTGWFQNCVPEGIRRGCTFEKGANFFRFIAREVGFEKKFRYRYGTIVAKERLELVSEMEGNIVIDASPYRVFDFPPGCRAIFQLSGRRLHVVKDFRGKE